MDFTTQESPSSTRWGGSILEYGTCLKTDVLRNAILRQDDESIREFIECEEKILEQLLSIGNDLELELRKFVYTKSYPFALEMEEFESYRYINHTVNRIIRDDLQEFKEFNSITTTKIAQLISYLATKKNREALLNRSYLRI